MARVILVLEDDPKTGRVKHGCNPDPKELVSKIKAGYKATASEVWLMRLLNHMMKESLELDKKDNSNIVRLR